MKPKKSVKPMTKAPTSRRLCRWSNISRETWRKNAPGLDFALVSIFFPLFVSGKKRHMNRAAMSVGNANTSIAIRQSYNTVRKRAIEQRTDGNCQYEQGNSQSRCRRTDMEIPAQYWQYSLGCIHVGKDKGRCEKERHQCPQSRWLPGYIG